MSLAPPKFWLKGTFKKDLSVHEHNFTNNGVKIGKNAIFNGAEYFTINNVLTTFASDTAGSWVIWVKLPDITPAVACELINFGDTDDNERIGLDISASGYLRAICVDAGENSWGIDTDAVIGVDDQWILVGLVQNGTEPVLYVNDDAPAQTFFWSADKTKWFSDCANLDNGYVGRLQFNGGAAAQYLDGEIYEIRMYDYAITEDHFIKIYEETRRWVENNNA